VSVFFTVQTKRTLWILACGAGGAFWLPGIALHAVRGQAFGSSPFDIIEACIFPLATSWAAWTILVRQRPDHIGRGALTLWMLLGIWMLGPICTTAAASFSGGGFSQAGAWHMIFLGIVFFVPLTFVMSAYDGSLAALVLVTVSFLIAAITFILKRWSELRNSRTATIRSHCHRGQLDYSGQ
jgi:hypothetical protein